MSTGLTVLLAVVMAGVLAVLFFGLFSMARGGEFNRRYGNKIMRARVGLQLLAVVVFVLVILTLRGS